MAYNKKNKRPTSSINENERGEFAGSGLESQINLREVPTCLLIGVCINHFTSHDSSVLGNAKVADCAFVNAFQQPGRRDSQAVLLHHEFTTTRLPQKENPDHKSNLASHLSYLTDVLGLDILNDKEQMETLDDWILNNTTKASRSKPSKQDLECKQDTDGFVVKKG